MEKDHHASSHHFLGEKIGVLNTLATHGLRISDVTHLEEEKSHILRFLRKNGYRDFHGLKSF